MVCTREVGELCCYLTDVYYLQGMYVIKPPFDLDLPHTSGSNGVKEPHALIEVNYLRALISDWINAIILCLVNAPELTFAEHSASCQCNKRNTHL